jgi:uncharacterized protein
MLSLMSVNNYCEETEMADEQMKLDPIQNPNETLKNGLTADERTWGMLCHLASFAGYIIPFGNIIGPLVVWLIKGEQYPFVDRQGRESINFQISMSIYFIVSAILILLLIGIVFMLVLFILELVFVIQASLRARQGEDYRYPLTIRFL